MQRLMHTQCLASTFKLHRTRISGGPKIANIIRLIINIFSFYTSQLKSMQSLGIFGGLSIMSKIIRQADGVHLGLPSSKENISSTGRMIKMGLNIHHSFRTRGLVPGSCLPVRSRTTQGGTTANSTCDMEQKEPLQHLLCSLQPHHQTRLPGSFNAESRRKKLMKEICREAIEVSRPGISAEMRQGAKPSHSINHQQKALYPCIPSSICTENLPQPLEHHLGLFWPHVQSSDEQQVYGQSLPWSAVLSTCIRAKNHPWLGLFSCCWSSGWIFQSSLKNQKPFRKAVSKGLLLFYCEEGLSGYKGWN